MGDRPRILAFAGSTRRDSFNKKLVEIASDGARSAGGEVTLIDLADFPMPLYDGDLERDSGLPEPARRLKALMIEHDGMLISAPEYNGSITAVLKNTIDWVSRRQDEDEPALGAFRGKSAALVAASPGRLGGLRGLVHVRQILNVVGVHVIPQQYALSGAGGMFDEDGGIKDDEAGRAAGSIGAALAEFLKKMAV